jgi:hypothetical protein
MRYPQVDGAPWRGFLRVVGLKGMRVGSRGFSTDVAAAVAHQLRRDSLREAIERMETKHGPADEADVQAAIRMIRGE